jgi:hypothetical protein
VLRRQRVRSAEASDAALATYEPKAKDNIPFSLRRHELTPRKAQMNQMHTMLSGGAAYRNSSVASFPM